MKKLPKIYQNEINKSIKNNKTVFRFKNEDSTYRIEQNDSNDKITETLTEIFKGIGYSYNIPVSIKTKAKTYKTSLVAKNSNDIVTIDNEIIPIKEIISIEKLKE